jgi:hypothetical protein
MSTINISYAMDHATNLDDVIKMVNDGTCEGMEGMEFSSEQLAGQYAFNAASTGDYPVNADAIAGQLEFLSDAGAVFNASAAIAHGLAIAAAETETEMNHITSVEITSISQARGQLFIDCNVELNNGEVIEYETMNEIEYLKSLSGLGGASSRELEELLGDDYMNEAAECLIKAAKAKWDSMEEMLADAKFKSIETIGALKDAITEFESIAGPVTFSVTESDDVFTLNATYSLKASPDSAPLDDEPWTQFGGYKIMERAGIDSVCGNAGMDRYEDKHGDQMFVQWVSFSK